MARKHLPEIREGHHSGHPIKTTTAAL